MATVSSVCPVISSSKPTKPTKLQNSNSAASPATLNSTKSTSAAINPKPSSDTLVKSSEKASQVPSTPEEWTEHILSQLPEQEKAPDLKKALHTHFQEVQQTDAPFEQEMRNVIGGPNAKDMSKHELAAEILKITLADPASEAAEKIQKIHSDATASIMPLQHTFLKSQNEAVQKAYFGVLEKTTLSAMAEMAKKAVPSHELESPRSSLPAEFMDDYRKAFVKGDIEKIVAYSKQGMEHGFAVLKRVKQFLSENNELATKFEAKCDSLARVFEHQRKRLNTAFEAKHDELTRKFEAKHKRLDKSFEAKRKAFATKLETQQGALATKFEPELDELSQKFSTYMQENNPFGELFQRITKIL